MIKKFSFLLSVKIWFEPMFFSGFFCGFYRCGSLRLRSVRAAAFPNFRGGTFSSATVVGKKAVRTNSSIVHQVGKDNASPRLGRGSATKSYGVFRAKRNSRFR